MGYQHQEFDAESGELVSSEDEEDMDEIMDEEFDDLDSESFDE